MPRKQRHPVHLDGTTLEGGGQLLRIALGLSTLTKKAIHITNIRGKRFGGGGLKAQHLTSLLWLGRASNAQISGAGLKSKEVTFTPDGLPSIQQDIAAGHVTIDQNTPGSINLVLQAVLPYLLFSGAQAPIQLRITGGTNVSNSPSHDYVEQVLIPMLSIIGIPLFHVTCHSRGWSSGSTGLGDVTFTITPLRTTLPSFQLTNRGTISSVRATVIAPGGTEQEVRNTLDLTFRERRPSIFGDAQDPKIDITFEDSLHDKRYYLLLVATTSTGLKLGRDWLYGGRIRAGQISTIVQQMVAKVFNDLITEIEHGGCVDEWMRDQFVVFQALAKGKSRVDGGERGETRVEPSLHAQTAMWVAERITGVTFDKEGGCEGMGFAPGDMERHADEVDVVECMNKLDLSQ
ncbi:hypothetical protein B9Z65_9193 [Elsinoe australis]|uniref:RNA 3'-terminal phosphate cyclase domain-containing protein n=1 Tax=Elsinoe australis TaxID=40998 RepID=A0A2P7Z0R6_9PEZI|nr:hypothetical protein B9Z65_9193 [Elsinoe australis]